MVSTISTLENCSQGSDKFQNCMRTKLLSMSELKSSIPKPTPYVRRRSERRPRTISSSPDKRNVIPTHSYIPAPCVSTCRKFSHSQSPSSKNQNLLVETKQKHMCSQSSSFSSRPNSANQPKICKNKQYMHIKSKIDNSPPYSLQQKKSTGLQSCSAMKASSQSIVNDIEIEQFMELSQGDQTSVEELISKVLKQNKAYHLKSEISSGKSSELFDTVNRDKIMESSQVDQISEEIRYGQCLFETKDLDIYEIDKEESSKEPQRNSVPFDCLMRKEQSGHIEGTSNPTSLLTTCAPEFLSSFEKEMQEISQSWLQLLRDVIIAKVTQRKNLLSRFSVPRPSKDQHREIFMFLKHLPCDGDPLHEKLFKIEEEQMKVSMVVKRNVMSLTKEYEKLKEKHYKLEKCQNEVNSRLEEELAILSQENKELVKKYTVAAEKYHFEKTKREEVDKHQVEIFKSVQETHKIIKDSEKKYSELESKVCKADCSYKSLEIKLRKLHLLFEKEGKKYEEMLSKYEKSEKTIKELRNSLEENKVTIASLEETKNNLLARLSSVKLSLDESLQTRNELVEEVSQKSNKMNELEAEIYLLKSREAVSNQDKATQVYFNNPENNLKNLLRRKNSQIQDLKKKTTRMAIILKERLSREEKLEKQIEELEKKFSNNINNNNTPCFEFQFQKMYRIIRTLLHEITELEKILGQKSVKTDQQNLLIQRYTKNVQPRNFLFSIVQSKMFEEEEFAKKLVALIFEHYNTHYKDNYCNNKDDRKNSESLKSLEKNSVDCGVFDERLICRKMKMVEILWELENKQMTLAKLERRLHKLQLIQEKKTEEMKL